MAKKTIERTALHAFTLNGEPVKPGQVVQLDRTQFKALVASGCVHESDDDNDAVPKLSLAGAVGTAIGTADAESAVDAGNAAHHNSGRLTDGAGGSAAQLLADAALAERRQIEAAVDADAARARQEAADAAARTEAAARARLEAEAKAKAEAEAKVKYEADAKARAEAEAKAAADVKAKAEAEAKGKPAVPPVGPALTSAPQTPRA